MREEIKLLEYHAGFPTNIGDVLHVMAEFDAIDDDLTVLMLFQPIDATDEGRLARTGGPNDNKHFLRHDFQRDIAQDVEIAKPLVHVTTNNYRLVARHHLLCAVLHNIPPQSRMPGGKSSRLFHNCCARAAPEPVASTRRLIYDMM